MSTVADRVAGIVAMELGIDKDEITPDSPFVTELGADSLDQARLVLEFEKVFGVKFPPGSAERIQSIGQVVALIETAKKSA